MTGNRLGHQSRPLVQEGMDTSWQATAVGKELFALDVGASVIVTKLELNLDDSMCPGGLRLDAAVQVRFVMLSVERPLAAFSSH